jgi:hypothetical protein
VALIQGTLALLLLLVSAQARLEHTPSMTVDMAQVRAVMDTTI